jgi:hypothetical protein
MVSAVIVLRWSQWNCRLILLVSDSCHGGNYGGNSSRNRSGDVAARETEAVARGGNRNRGSTGGNIEATERWRR